MKNENEDNYILRADDPEICSESSSNGGFIIFLIIIGTLLLFFLK